MDTAIQKAYERQGYVLSDDEALRIYEMRQKAHWDFLSSTNYAREEGREEGRAEGLVEGREEGSMASREEIAWKALAEGLSIEVVKKITVLSGEEIEKLR